MDRLAQPEPGPEPELGRRAAAIDHADVADEVELGDREARDAEPERERQDRLCHRVRDRTRLAAELLEHRRQRHLAGADDVVDAAPAGRERARRSPRRRPATWIELHHRIEAEQDRRPLDPQVVRRRVVHRADDVDRAQDHGLDLARAPEERRHEVIDLDEIAHLREPLRGEQRRVLGEELRVVGARAVDVRLDSSTTLGTRYAWQYSSSFVVPVMFHE